MTVKFRLHLCSKSRLISVHPERKLRLGKADFKSAFKTLPVASDQKWLCYSLVYNPEKQCLQVVQLWTQAFGSLGGVVAWYRTAKLIQKIMLELFHIVVFAYVDDFFWVMPDGSTDDINLADFVLSAFKHVREARKWLYGTS